MKFSNNIAVDPHTDKTRRCHIDRSGEISIHLLDPSSLRSVGMTAMGKRLYYYVIKVMNISKNNKSVKKKGPHFREAPGFLGIVCPKLLSSDYASHLTNLV